MIGRVATYLLVIPSECDPGWAFYFLLVGLNKISMDKI